MHAKERNSSSPIATPPPDAESETTEWHIKDHWKCLVACSLVSLCPFQYGLDFGLISGVQAMVGFLRVRTSLPLPFFPPTSVLSSPVFPFISMIC